MCVRYLNIGILLILVSSQSYGASSYILKDRNGSYSVGASHRSTDEINKTKSGDCNMSIANSAHNEINKDIGKQRRCLLGGKPPSSKPNRLCSSNSTCPKQLKRYSSESDESDSSYSSSSESEEQSSSESEEQTRPTRRPRKESKDKPGAISIDNEAKNNNNITINTKGNSKHGKSKRGKSKHGKSKRGKSNRGKSERGKSKRGKSKRKPTESSKNRGNLAKNDNNIIIGRKKLSATNSNNGQ